MTPVVCLRALYVMGALIVLMKRTNKHVFGLPVRTKSSGVEVANVSLLPSAVTETMIAPIIQMKKAAMPSTCVLQMKLSAGAVESAS